MTTVNLVIFGIGNVGSTLIQQLLEFKEELKLQQDIEIKIPIICNSTKVLFTDTIQDNFEEDFQENSKAYQFTDILDFVAFHNLENTIAIDATASKSFAAQYLSLIENDFHIVSANKIANTLDYKFYEKFREKLQERNKKFYYETNVGAGLPVIETVKNLVQSGEKVKKIRGVFSGSLSYIFNRFSEEDIAFSEVLNSAAKNGYTEPDAREDLSGADVARKLLILGREIGFTQNIESVGVQSLVPKTLNEKTTLAQFNSRVGELNPLFQNKKNNTKENEVLRYIGELNAETEALDVKLISESKSSALGQLKGADTLFEIYTEAYNKTPLVIQGAGAGKEVTARGLFTDIIKLTNQLA